MLEIALSALVIGTVMGGILALVASGFTLTFGVGRIFNFAHGTFFAISAYSAYALFPYLGYLSLLIGVLLAGVFGVIINYLVKPIRHHEIMVILLTLSLALLIEQILLITFRDISITIQPIVQGYVDVFGVRLSYVKLLSLIIAIAVIVGLELFIKKTKLGREINATSQSYESAMMVGIDVDRIFLITLFISSVLAGLGGILYAQIYSINPETTFKILIYAFAVVILGGLGSVKGSIVSAFIIGYIQIIVSLMLGTRWSELAVIAVIIAILIVRPKGLFGVE